MRTLGLQSPAVHDGFATIHGAHSTAGKSCRARSSSSHHNYTRALPPHSCAGNKSSHCRVCAPRTMEPLWEEKGGGAGRSPVVGDQPSGPAVGVPRRERNAPWWDIATRRSRYRSCPAFSPSSVVCVLEHTVSSVTDRLERLASSPDLKESEADELRQTVAALKKHSSAMSHSLSNGLLSLERKKSCDSVSSLSSTLSGGSLSPYRATCGYRGVSGAGTPGGPHWNGVAVAASSSVSNHPGGSDARPRSDNESESKLKKRSWLRNSFRKAFGRKRSKPSHDATNVTDIKRPSSGGGTTLLSRLLNNQTNNQTITHDLPVNHCRNTAVSGLSHKPHQTYATQNGIRNAQIGVCDPQNGSLTNHFSRNDILTTTFTTRSFNFLEKSDGDHCQELLPTMNSTLSINPFGLMDAVPQRHKDTELSHADALVSTSTSPKSGSKSLDHLDECCRSQVSSVRNSSHYTTDSAELLYPTSCTAALLRDSLDRKGDVSKTHLQEELAEKQRALTACKLQLMEAQEQLNKHADTIAGLQLECQRLGQQNQQLVILLRHHLGPAAETVLAAALSTLSMSSSDQHEKSPSEPFQPCSAIPPYISSTLPRPSSAGRRLKVKVVQSETGLVNAADALKRQPETENSQLVGSVTIWPKTSWADLDGLLHNTINEYTQKVFHGACTTSLEDRSSSTTADSTNLHSVHSSKRAMPSDSSSRSFVSKNESTSRTSFSSIMTSGFGSSASKHTPSSGQESDQVYNQGLKDDSGSSSPKSSMFIYCYRIAEVLRAIELLPELLPYGYCVGNVTEIYVWLKGVLSNAPALGESSSERNQSTQERKTLQTSKLNSDVSVSSVSCDETHFRGSQDSDTSAISFFSNIPQEIISSLALALKESQRLLICGPQGSGKTSLVRALARYASISFSGKVFSEATVSSSDDFTQNSLAPCAQVNPKTFPEDLVTWFTVSGTNGLQLCHLLTSIMKQSSSSNSSEKCSENFSENNPAGSCVSSIKNTSAVNFSSNDFKKSGSKKPLRVMVIEDIHQGCGVSETIERCLSEYADVAFVVTTQQSPYTCTNLSRVCGFRCVELQADQEPVRGLLGRVLRQRVLNAALHTEQPLPQLDIIATWLQQLWLYLNTVTLAPSDDLSAHSKAQSPAFLPRSLQRSPGSPSCISDKFSGKHTPGVTSCGRVVTESGQSHGEFTKDVSFPSFSRTNFGASKSNQPADQSSSSSGYSKLFLNPGVFMDCPMDLIKSQKWFLKKWNYSVIPQLRKVLSSTPKSSPSSNEHFQSTTSSGENAQRGNDHVWRSMSDRFHKENTQLATVPIANLADPLQWVLSTYPWPASVDFGSHNLISLREIDAPPPPRSQPSLFHSPSPPTPTLPPKEKQKFMSEGIYAVPSIRPASKLSPAPSPNSRMILSSVDSSNTCSGPPHGQSTCTDDKDVGIAASETRKSTLSENLHDTSSESVGHEVPSSMALIVPFTTVAIKNKEPNCSLAAFPSDGSQQNEIQLNGHGSGIGYDANRYGSSVPNYGCNRSNYRPLKSFGRYSKSNDCAQLSLPIDSSNNECLIASKSRPSHQDSSCSSTRGFARVDNTGENKQFSNSVNTCAYRLSGSHSSGSDEVMDSVSSSPTTVPNEPIYFTIQKDSGKSESPEDSDMDMEPIYFTIPSDQEDTSTSQSGDLTGVDSSATFADFVNPKLPNRRPVTYSSYNHVPTDQSDTVVISCRQDVESKPEIKNTARTLTSTFKPFETIM
ncbi:P-loop containing nucleoside triphosphate hydrolase [Trinorchestia longiramus]|nr:P-loop containing nucleoside triphosphate hydrolase [Trinorchestia longiramus]